MQEVEDPLGRRPLVGEARKHSAIDWQKTTPGDCEFFGFLASTLPTSSVGSAAVVTYDWCVRCVWIRDSFAGVFVLGQLSINGLEDAATSWRACLRSFAGRSPFLPQSVRGRNGPLTGTVISLNAAGRQKHVNLDAEKT
jgi:hypothetical protein